jgi:hypothetical protein
VVRARHVDAGRGRPCRATQTSPCAGFTLTPRRRACGR